MSVFAPTDARDIGLLRAHEEASDYVKLELICLEWRVASFSIVVRINTPLHTIRRHILERFPGADHLCIYRTSDMKKEPLSLQLTLADVGFTGGFRESHMTATLYFNFQSSCRDPILKSSRVLSLYSDIVPTSQCPPKLSPELVSALAASSSDSSMDQGSVQTAALPTQASSSYQPYGYSSTPTTGSLTSTSYPASQNSTTLKASDPRDNLSPPRFTRNTIGSVTFTDGLL